MTTTAQTNINMFHSCCCLRAMCGVGTKMTLDAAALIKCLLSGSLPSVSWSQSDGDCKLLPSSLPSGSSAFMRTRWNSCSTSGFHSVKKKSFGLLFLHLLAMCSYILRWYFELVPIQSDKQWELKWHFTKGGFEWEGGVFSTLHFFPGKRLRSS